MTYKEFNKFFEVSWQHLLRKVARGTRGLLGATVGYEVKGYLRFELNCKSYAVHNVIWMIYNQKDIPEGFVVDHEDGDSLNNCPNNLRLASKFQNGYNSRLYTNNSSGYKGVSFDKETGKWLAQIREAGRNKKIGRFATAELANEAVVRVRANLHGAFANDG